MAASRYIPLSRNDVVSESIEATAEGQKPRAATLLQFEGDGSIQAANTVA